MKKRDSSERKRGSVTVLIMILLSTIVTVFFALYNHASMETLKQAVRWNGENAGDSLLSYYLPELKDRYDLYGLWKEPEILTWRMEQYVEDSSPFWTGAAGRHLLQADCEEIRMDPSKYCMEDPNLVKQQMDAVMKQGAAVNLIRDMDLVEMIQEVLGLAGEGLELQEEGLQQVQRSQREEPQEEKVYQKRQELEGKVKQGERQGEAAMETIRMEHGKQLTDGEVIRQLPSQSTGDSTWESSWDRLRKDPGTLGEVIRSSLFTDLYALEYFGNYRDRQEGWFECQVEYILHGEFSDEENLEKTKRDLFFLRTLLNGAALYRDQSLRQLVEAAATAAVPVPYPVAFGMITAAISAAEAGEDVKRLMEGESISVLKSAEEWVSVSADGTEVPGEEGIQLSYENHLHILLLLRSQEQKVLRMMDLIQLDLQRTLGKSFSWKEICCGFDWEIQADLNCSTGRERRWTCEGNSQFGF